ncbi:hypothetical protein DRP53_07050 [candidate division WOR-3 bacterium]|uniref:Uncharacterized protein n=1 Tax=candidate division WOR-3 bacterium TaxID=2052148 RepID=A0A660SG61_UNCW3|nr:MAG: hypothetical protein DRP53_07050 [candidate division WOR-3 bacterium]
MRIFCFLLLILLGSCYYERFSILESLPYFDLSDHSQVGGVDGPLTLSGFSHMVRVYSDSGTITAISPGFGLRIKAGAKTDLGVFFSYPSTSRMKGGYLSLDLQTLQLIPPYLVINFGAGAGIGQCGPIADVRISSCLALPIYQGFIIPFVAPKFYRIGYPYTTLDHTAASIYGISGGIQFSYPIWSRNLLIQIGPGYYWGREPVWDRVRYSILTLGGQAFFTLSRSR